MGAENSLRLSEPSLWLKRSAGEIDVSRRGDGENASRESVCFLALRSHDSVAHENENTMRKILESLKCSLKESSLT